eukprot:jgi/Hompol1/3113/HPOL_006344-RA
MNILIRKCDDHSFYLREWSDRLRPGLIKHANDVRVSQFLRNRFPSPYTNESADKFFSALKNNPLFTSYAIVKEMHADCSEEAIGTIGTTFSDPTDIEAHVGEIGYWLGYEYWGIGLMTDTLRVYLSSHVELTRKARTPMPLSRLVLIAVTSNAGSCRVAEKNGFQLEELERQRIIANAAANEKAELEKQLKKAAAIVNKTRDKNAIQLLMDESAKLKIELELLGDQKMQNDALKENIHAIVMQGDTQKKKLEARIA